MAEEPEKLTIRLLQELRGAMRDLRSEVGELREDVASTSNRVDGNTLLLNMLAAMLHDHEHRVRALEGVRSWAAVLGRQANASAFLSRS